MKIEANIVTTVVIGMGGALIGGLVLRVLLSVMGMAAALGAVLGAADLAVADLRAEVIGGGRGACGASIFGKMKSGYSSPPL